MSTKLNYTDCKTDWLIMKYYCAPYGPEVQVYTPIAVYNSIKLAYNYNMSNCFHYTCT